MKREPVAAGRYYPGSAEELREMIAGFVDNKAEKEDVIGLLMPHAGYQYSGAVAAAAISRVRFKNTFIIMGPSHTGAGKPFGIMTEGTWRTPLGEVEIDSELANKIVEVSELVEEDHRPHQQEHAVEVQIPFLQYFRKDIKMVPLILAYARPTAYKQIGRDIARAIKELNKDVVIIASGDMTHYEPQATAEDKDGKAIEAMLALDEDELTRRFEELNITMCAHGPAVSLITAAKELGANKAELVMYQTSGDSTGDYDAVVGYAGVIFKAGGMHPLAALAKNTVETYVKTGKRPPPPTEPTPEMKAKAGVFVSIHKLGELRGCIGTFEPQQENVAIEIITNAISSATRDPRFNAVTEKELKDLDYSVDVLTEPEPVSDASGLDPKRYGIIVEAGWRKGLLLPDLEGVDSVDEQIDICRQKGGIGAEEPVTLYRFEVQRYK